MGLDDDQTGKEDRDIIEGEGVSVLQEGIGKDGGAGMEDDRKAEFLGTGVKGKKPAVIGIEMLVGGIEFDAFESLLTGTPFQVIYHVECGEGVYVGKRDEAIAHAAKRSNPFVRADSGDHRIVLRENDGVVYPLLIEKSKEGFRRGEDLLDPRQKILSIEPFCPLGKPGQVFLQSGDMQVKIDDGHLGVLI
jgi:hypothetical protein